MPCLQLYSFSDTVSQGITLSPDLYVETGIGAGDSITQPLWVRVILVNVFPDARKYIRIQEDFRTALAIQANAERAATIFDDGYLSTKYSANANVTVCIAQDLESSVNLKKTPEEATVVLGIAEDTTLRVKLFDSDATLYIQGDASRTLQTRVEPEALIHIKPNAEAGVLVAGSDTMEAEACQEFLPPVPPTEP
jgi:hypothetical protein